MGFRSQIRRFWRDFKGYTLPVKIGILSFLVFMILSATVFVYSITVYSVFSLNQLYLSYLKPLGFDYKSPFSNFMSIIIIFWFICYIFFLFKKFNWYIVATGHIILFLVIFGLSFINQSYSVDLPISIEWKNSSYNNLVNLTDYPGCSLLPISCKSVRDKVYFVDGDEVYCQFGISKNCDLVLSNFEVSKLYLNSDQAFPINATFNSKEAIFSISIENKLKAVWVIPYLLTDRGVIAPHYIYMEFENVYSDEEYRQMQSEKSSLIIALISLSVFSSIVAVNNLKQILQRKKV